MQLVESASGPMYHTASSSEQEPEGLSRRSQNASPSTTRQAFTYRQHVSNDDIPEHEGSLLWEGSVEDGSNLVASQPHSSLGVHGLPPPLTC